MQPIEIRGSALLERIRSYSIIYHCNLLIALSNFVFSLCLCAIIEFTVISSVLFYARCTCKKLSFTFEHADKSFNDDSITSLSFIFLQLQIN